MYHRHRIRSIIAFLFTSIWGYLLYSFIFQYPTCSSKTPTSKDYVKRVDTTISLLEEWRDLLFHEFHIGLNKEVEKVKAETIDSMRNEWKKNPIIVVKEKIVEKEIEKPVDNSAKILLEKELKMAKSENEKLRETLFDLNKQVEHHKRRGDSLAGINYKPKKNRWYDRFIIRKKSTPVYR